MVSRLVRPHRSKLPILFGQNIPRMHLRQGLVKFCCLLMIDDGSRSYTVRQGSVGCQEKGFLILSKKNKHLKASNKIQLGR